MANLRGLTMKQFITLKEAAEELGLSTRTMQREYPAYCHRHSVKTYKPTKKVLLDRKDFFRSIRESRIS